MYKHSAMESIDIGVIQEAAHAEQKQGKIEKDVHGDEEEQEEEQQDNGGMEQVQVHRVRSRGNTPAESAGTGLVDDSNNNNNNNGLNGAGVGYRKETENMGELLVPVIESDHEAEEQSQKSFEIGASTEEEDDEVIKDMHSSIMTDGGRQEEAVGEV